MARGNHCWRGKGQLEKVCAVGAVLVALSGLALGLHVGALFGDRSGFDHVIKMIDVETNGTHTKELMLALVIACFVTTLVGVTGLIGIIVDNHGLVCMYFAMASALAIYFMWAMAFGSTIDAEVLPVMERHGQEFCSASIHELYFIMLGCNSTAHPFLDKTIASGRCGVSCASRLSLLERMGGCSFLHALCRGFVYTDMGRGQCLVQDGHHFGEEASQVSKARTPMRGPYLLSSGPPVRAAGSASKGTGDSGSPAAEPDGIAGLGNVVGASAIAGGLPMGLGAPQRALHKGSYKDAGSATESCCRQTCDLQTECPGYAYDSLHGKCLLVAATPPPSWAVNRRSACTRYQWEQLPATDDAGVLVPQNGSLMVVGAVPSLTLGSRAPAGTMQCYRKELKTELMRQMVRTGVWLTLGSFVAVLALLGASCCGCLLQYTLTTRRQGRKGAVALLVKMMCPCCPQERRPANRVALEKGESDSDEASPLRPY